MKITRRQIRRIIREAVLNEALPPHLQKHFRKDGSSVHQPESEIKDVTPAGYGPEEHIDLYLDLGADGDFPTLNDGDSEKQWEVPYFTSAPDFLDEVLSQLPGSTPDTIVVGEEMDLPDLPLSQVWDAVMAAGRRR